jgi:hypothetical protein
VHSLAAVAYVAERRVVGPAPVGVQVAQPLHNLARVNLSTPNIDVAAGRRHRSPQLLQGGMDLSGPLRKGMRVQYRRLCLRPR